jgi:nucleotide-binding universal stress UspA family protein/sporulation protein YlmC with PRC-barrel domain
VQKRILVPLDGSPLADRVLAQLRRLLTTRDHEAVLLTVVPADPDPKAVDRRRQDARDHLAGVRDALVDQGALASIEVLVGDAAEQIVAHATRIQAELVVMATHGRTGLSRFVRGSVAESVIRTCPVPVLVANPKAVDVRGAHGELRLSKLLVPLDGSETSRQVLPLVEAIAKQYDSEVLLLHVHWIPYTTDPYMTTYAPPPPEQITAGLEPVRQALAARGIRARSVAGVGPEALGIVATADSEDVDLVVMSTHGRSGVSRWLWGSVAEQVLRHCTRPLLVRRVHVVTEPAPAAPAAPAERAPTLSGRELIGAKVQDLTHEDLGTVDDLVLDPASGRVTYAVLRFGGLLGLGEKLFPVPWSALHWRPDGTFVLQHHGKKRDELRDAPHVKHRAPHDRHEWLVDMAPAVHSFYPGARF